MERDLTLKMAVVGSMIPVIMETQKAIKVFAAESEWNLKKVSAGFKAIGTVMVGLAAAGIAAAAKFDSTMKDLVNSTHMNYREQLEFAESARQSALQVGLSRDQIIEAATAYRLAGGSLTDYSKIQKEFVTVLSASGLQADVFGEKFAKFQVLSKLSPKEAIDIWAKLFDFGNKGMGPTFNKFIENNDPGKMIVDYMESHKNATADQIFKQIAFMMTSYEPDKISRLMARAYRMFDFTQTNSLYGTKFSLNDNIYEIMESLDKVYSKLGYNAQQKMVALQRVFRMSTPEVERMTEQYKKFEEVLKTTDIASAFEQATDNAGKLSVLITGISDALLTGFQKGFIEDLFAGMNAEQRATEIKQLTNAFNLLAISFGHVAAKGAKFFKMLTDHASLLPAVGAFMGFMMGGQIGSVAGAGFGVALQNELFNAKDVKEAQDFVNAHPEGVKDWHSGLIPGMPGSQVTIVNNKVYLKGIEMPIEKQESSTTHEGTSNQRDE